MLSWLWEWDVALHSAENDMKFTKADQEGDLKKIKKHLKAMPLFNNDYSYLHMLRASMMAKNFVTRV